MTIRRRMALVVCVFWSLSGVHLANGDSPAGCLGDCDSFASPVAQTGQKECWDGTSPYPEIDCAATGQDGEYRAGVTVDPRFTDNGDGTVSDNLTGLIWLQQANCFSGTWSEALSFANTLANGSCGLTDGSLVGDWRLPNVKEGLSLFDYSEEFPALLAGHPFIGVPQSINDERRYWTSTTLGPTPGSPGSAWRVDSTRGELLGASKTGTRRAWAVRGPPEAPTACEFASPVPQTGQNECRQGVSPFSKIDCAGTGQDGEYLAGVTVDPRFTDNGDGSLTDNLTGLTWLQQADCFFGTWSGALSFANGLGDGSCGLSDGSLSGDWRLPNVREWHSLLDYGQTFPPLPPGHPFVGVPVTGLFTDYWASTSIPGVEQSAFHVDMQVGRVSQLLKSNSLHALAVRGPVACSVPLPAVTHWGKIGVTVVLGLVLLVLSLAAVRTV